MKMKRAWAPKAAAAHLRWMILLVCWIPAFAGTTSLMAWTRTDTLFVTADSGDGRGLGTDFSRTGEMYHGYLNGNGIAQSYNWVMSKIPAGQTIVAAVPYYRANGNIAGTDTSYVMLENANNVSPPTSVANWNSRTVTDSVQWLGGGTWTSGTRYRPDSVAFTTIFTALYNAGYCDSGEYLNLFWKGRNVSTNTAVRRTYGYDISTSYPVWIIVTHSTAATGTKSGRRRMLQIGSLEPQYREWTQWERIE